MTDKIHRAILALALAGVAACSGPKLPVQPSPSPSTAPLPARSSDLTPPIPAEPITSFTVWGSVRDTFFNGLADVPVEIIDGPMSCTVVRTGPSGQFKFPDPFPEEATLRATKDGYVTATARAPRPTTRTVGGPQTLVTIELPSPEPPEI